MGNGNWMVPVGSTQFIRYLESNDWTRTGSVGDHEVYQYKDGRKAHVPKGGRWNRELPRICLKAVAIIMGTTAADLLRELR